MIQILHLSDIQYGRHHVDKDSRKPLYPDKNYSQQLDKLIDDLKILKDSRNIVPNFIVVTGDIAEWSRRDEYKAAGEFLGGLADYLKIDRRYVVMVPGNHDINRKVCQASRLMADAEAECYNPPYFQKFKFYKEFFDTFYKDASFPERYVPYRFTESQLFVNFVFPEEGVAFIGLNSCVDESELPTHYGNITVEQLKKALSELNAHDPKGELFRVALMHHNFVRSSENDEENLKDADDLKPLMLSHNIRLILHGHQHVPRAEVTGTGDRIIPVLATGSAGLDSVTLPETPRRYQVIDIDQQNVRVYRRFFDNTHMGKSGKGCWKPDMAPDQAEIFDHFTIPGLSRKESEKDDDKIEILCEIPKSLKIPVAYREWVGEKCRHMDVDRLREKGSAITVGLPEMFIPLYSNPHGKGDKNKIDDLEILLKDRGHYVDVEDLIAEDGDLLISGEAGSGKTTLVKHFVYMALNNPDWKDLGDFLPILVFLKDLRAFDITNAGRDEETAAKLLALSFRKSGCGLDVETIKNYCAAGKALFFLDGLDEIPMALRNVVINSFSAFRRHCRGGRFILAGRPHGLEGDVVDFIKDRKATILPLTMEQVEKCIFKWFQHVKRSKSKPIEKTAEGMISEIKSVPGVERLVHNPLMLTAVCILYYDKKKLPGQRAELYKKFVENMLHRRFPDPEQVLSFLMTLAFHMHTSPQKLKGIDKEPALDILKQVYRQGDRPDDEYQIYIQKQFNRIEPDCGLLKFDGGQLMFRHLTFQEFLTAGYIKDRKTKYDEAIQTYWQDEWFKEVIELLVGLLSIDNRQWANDLVEEAFKKQDAPPFYAWRLGAQSILDIHEDRRNTNVVDLAAGKMRHIMASKAGPKDRADAGELLGWLGDRRDLEIFTSIPDGKYDTSVGKVALNGFEMSKYLVTNQWYKKFIDSGGYRKEAFWPPEGMKWLKHTGVKHPLGWHDRQWSCPNHPVIGVCWYEAAAFCRWLTEVRNDGVIYRLPSEKEWEATAAGFEKRVYPWGKDFDKNRSNVEGTKIERTSAVGIFKGGETPEGVNDLAGNVWEWTGTSYHTQKKLDDFRFETDAQELYDKIISSSGDEQKKRIDDYLKLREDKNRRLPVLRGGSWTLNRGFARCGYRNFNHPDNRLSFIGFRCSRTKN